MIPGGRALTLTALFWSLPLAGWSQAPLHEGVARYHYYQQEYLPALSELMVARAQGDLEQNRGATLEGAIRLAFGMATSAERQLTPALADKPEQAAAARFYLGKLHYLRGDWQAAADVWSGLGEALKPALARERRALDWQWRLRTNAPEPVAPDELWDSLGDWAPQILYNLGGAYARQGDQAQARQYYRVLAERAPEHFFRDPEYLALRDRAYTALGFSHLLENDVARAEAWFDQVRLTRDDADQALLGYGWAALENGVPETSVRAWQALSERSLTNSATQEALIALPHAYVRLGADAAAIDAYDRAEQRLESELARVDNLKRALTPDYLLHQLDRNDSEGRLQLSGRENWLTLTEAAVARSPDPYLADWVNQSRFQSQVQALSDLRDQGQLLARWPDKLRHYGQLLREKRELRQTRQADVVRESLWQQADHLRERRQPLARELARIEREGDYLAVADSDTQALYERTRAAMARLDRLMGTGRIDDIQQKRARLQLYRGILLWRAAQAYPENIWRAEKPLRGLDRALETLSERRESVRAIVSNNPDIEPTLARMATLQTRIDNQRARLARAQQVRAEQLVASLNGHLDRHKARLTRYLARVRLGAAQLQDRALSADGGAP